MMPRYSIAIFTILLVPGCFGTRDEALDTQGLNSHVSVTCDANTEKATLEMNEASAKVVRVFAEESDALRKRLRYLEDLEEKDDAKATEYRGRYEFWNVSCRRMTDSDAERLAREQSELRILNIMGNEITDAGLNFLAQLRRLEVLIISEIRSASRNTLTRPLFTPDGLSAFQAKNPTCVVRRVPSAVFYDPCANFSPKDVPVETREVGVAVFLFAPVTKEIFDAIKDFHEVQWFKAPDYSKHTPRNAMTDKSMQILAQLPRLETLDVAGAERITDVGLGYFVGHPKIEYIRIQATSVTEEGVRMFRHAMPHVRVFYSQDYVDGD